jgi:hypothetical protein
MNHVKRIINENSSIEERRFRSQILTDKSLTSNINLFCESLKSLKPVKGKKYPDEHELMITITFSFSEIDKYLFSLSNCEEIGKMTEITIYLLSNVCIEFKNDMGIVAQRQLCKSITEYSILHKPAKGSFIQSLIDCILENINLAESAGREFCRTYYDCTLNDIAMNELISLCGRFGWLRCAASFSQLFIKHYCDLKILWDKDRLFELVCLFDQLRDKAIIKIRGNKGFWKAIQDHLCDFNGNHYVGTLWDVFNEYSKNKEAYKRRTKKVDLLIDLVLNVQNRQDEQQMTKNDNR